MKPKKRTSEAKQDIVKYVKFRVALYTYAMQCHSPALVKNVGKVSVRHYLGLSLPASFCFKPQEVFEYFQVAKDLL